MVTALAKKSRAEWKPSDLGPVPAEWEVREVSTYDPFITSGSRGWAKLYTDNGAPFVRITNLSHSETRLDLKSLKFVSVDPDEPEAKRTRLEVGDVLISITADIGAIGIVGNDLPSPAYINQHIACIRFPTGNVDPRFVAYWLISETSQRAFRAMIDVGAKSGLNLTTIKKIRLLAPPMKEQGAIADALSDMDDLVLELERLVAKKRAIKQGIMDAVLTGSKRLPGCEAKLSEMRLQEVAFIDPENLAGSTPADFSFNYIALEDVDRGNLVSHSELTFAMAPSRARRVLRAGDVLVSTVRPNRKSHLLFSARPGHWIGSTGFSVVRCKPGIAAPNYVLHQLFGAAVSKQIETLIAGSNYPAISGRDVAALRIPMPPYDEQVQIAGMLDEMEADIASLEMKAAKAGRVREGMMQELLTGRVRLV